MGVIIDTPTTYIYLPGFNWTFVDQFVHILGRDKNVGYPPSHVPKIITEVAARLGQVKVQVVDIP